MTLKTILDAQQVGFAGYLAAKAGHQNFAISTVIQDQVNTIRIWAAGQSGLSFVLNTGHEVSTALDFHYVLPVDAYKVIKRIKGNVTITSEGRATKVKGPYLDHLFTPKGRLLREDYPALVEPEHSNCMIEVNPAAMLDALEFIEPFVPSREEPAGLYLYGTGPGSLRLLGTDIRQVGYVNLPATLNTPDDVPCPTVYLPYSVLGSLKMALKAANKSETDMWILVDLDQTVTMLLPDLGLTLILQQGKDPGILNQVREAIKRQLDLVEVWVQDQSTARLYDVANAIKAGGQEFVLASTAAGYLTINGEDGHHIDTADIDREQQTLVPNQQLLAISQRLKRIKLKTYRAGAVHNGPLAVTAGDDHIKVNALILPITDWRI